MLRLITACCVVLISAAAPARQYLPLSSVPLTVRQAAERAAPDVEWLPLSCKIEYANQPTVYRLAGYDSQHRYTMAEVEDGNVNYFITRIDNDQVPASAREAVAARFPGFRATSSEGISRDTKTFLWYRCTGSIDGKGIEVIVNPLGTDVMTKDKAAKG